MVALVVSLLKLSTMAEALLSPKPPTEALVQVAAPAAPTTRQPPGGTAPSNVSARGRLILGPPTLGSVSLQSRLLPT